MAQYTSLKQEDTSQEIDNTPFEVSDELYKSAVDDYNRWLNNFIAEHYGLWVLSDYNVDSLRSKMGANSYRDTFDRLRANVNTQKAAYEAKLAKVNEKKENFKNANHTISDATKELSNLQFAGDSHTNAMNQLAQAKDDYYNYVNATTGELNTLRYYLGQYVGSKKDAIQDRINEINKERNKLFTAYENAANSSNSVGLSRQETLADQALKNEAISNQSTSIADKKKNISAGIDKTKAGLLGSQEANKTTIGEATQGFAQNVSNQANSQADWLRSQGVVTAAQNEATNAGKAIPNASISGALQGAGTGASMGMVISDENEKEEPSQDHLLELADKFIELYNKLKEAK